MSESVPYYLKSTPLYSLMKEHGGVFVEYVGYYMPVNFSNGIIFEHNSVRNNVGLFDISHMGEIKINGQETIKFINYVGTNNLTKISNQQMQYQILCFADGGAIDDMMAYKFSDQEVLLVCNAANKDSVYQHLLKEAKNFKVEVIDESNFTSAIAVQGPKALEAMRLLTDLEPLKYLNFITVDDLLISRSGYTGEDGFEIYGSDKKIIELTKKLLNQGVILCGLGSRDTLRFEAGLPLYGHELADYISPIQAGLNFAIDFNKESFIGKEALLNEKNNLKQKIYGLELLDKGIARQGYLVFDAEKEIGFITSGFMIPGTKSSYANALLSANYKIGDIVEIEIRSRKIKAVIRKKKYINK
ncbi:MAG: glycine cleavage system aminomethyltransferase GcvT [Acholeplasmataceae bacterium]|nr:glycine cleavage system aminomethyltransferase GcvT [Acholeplasmataceae bacterium]